MSTTLDATESVVLEGTAPAADMAVTWRHVLRSAAFGQVILAGFMLGIELVFEGRFDPTAVVIGAVAGIGVAWLGRSSGRGAAVYAGVVSLLLVAMVAAFGGLTVLLRPQSTFELILFGGLLVVGGLGLVATPGAWRATAGRGAAMAPKVAGAAIAALVVVGVVAGGLTGSATRMAGDLRLRAKQYEFSRATLTAHAGQVAVFVENKDVAAHDFTIKGVVHESLPGQRSTRAVFDVRPGTYRFYCSLHPGMEGTLKVS